MVNLPTRARSALMVACGFLFLLLLEVEVPLSTVFFLHFIIWTGGEGSVSVFSCPNGKGWDSSISGFVPGSCVPRGE